MLTYIHSYTKLHTYTHPYLQTYVHLYKLALTSTKLSVGIVCIEEVYNTVLSAFIGL